MIGRRKIVLDHDDFTHHVLFTGSTGSGKTTFARNLCVKTRDALDAAVIFIDPKGIDAPKLLEEVELDDSVLYLDPARGFSFNPLALPPHDPKDRERIVSLYIGHFRQLASSWFSGRGDLASFAPRMTWLFESTLRYLYKKTDTPTFGDIVAIAHIFLERDKSKIAAFLVQTDKDLRDSFTGRELKVELEVLPSLTKDAWFPLLNRLSQFATDDFLSKIFNVRRGTVNVLDLLEPGRLTVVKAAGIGEQVVGLFISAIVLGVWFNVRYRREVLKKQSLVLVVGDELHVISDMLDINVILAQARAFDLGLIFLLLNLFQLPPPLRASLLANTHTQIAGKISGDDAASFCKNWGICKEEHSRFHSWMTAPPVWKPWSVLVRGRDRTIDVYDLPPPPERVNKFAEVERWVSENNPGFGVPAPPLTAELTADVREFENYLPGPLPSELEWKLLIAIEKPATFSKAVTKAAVPRTTPTKDAWESLINRGMIIKSSRAHGAEYIGRSKETQRLYFTPDFSRIARSEEGQRLAELAWRHHLELGSFIVIAPQRLGEFKVDLIAYDYKARLPIAVEIESTSEIKTHAEQVAINIKKFSELGFSCLQIWFPKALNSKIKELLGSVKNVELFPC
jgi:hypothetical protein